MVVFAGCNHFTTKSTYQDCNDLLSACSGHQNGGYCLYGYKWGVENSFTNNGVEASGPGRPGGVITYALYPPGETVHIHSEDDLTTLSFDLINVCDAGEQITRAMESWSAMANFEVQLINEVQEADIRFALADIVQGGVGNPAFTDDLCSLLAGLVVLDYPTRNTCDGFLNLLLHESGHAFGLGHVNSNNIMNANGNESITQLGEGDIQGIQSIYGMN